MPIFIVQNKKLTKLSSAPLLAEKALQTLVEQNLLEVLDLHFLATEYATTFGGRIDTLAVDVNGAPVIIEYKRGRNDNVINQGLSYLRWLKSQKQEFFEKLMADKLAPDVCKQIELDWKNPRVICIAESYSKFDIDTVEVVPLRIELWKYRFYQRDVFSLEPVNVPETVTAKANEARTVEAPQISADRSDHTEKSSHDISELYKELRERIMSLDEAVTEKQTKLYVAYRVANNFAEVMFGRNHLKIALRPVDYDDPRGLVEVIPESYNWSLDRRVYLRSADDLDYVMGLIEQSYRDVL